MWRRVDRGIMCVLLLLLTNIPVGGDDTETKNNKSRIPQIVVPLHHIQQVQMKTKKRVRTAINDSDKIIKVSEFQGDPTSVLLAAQSIGTARLTLIDIDEMKETYDVVVCNLLYVPVGNSQPVHLSTKKPIKEVHNDGEKTIRLERSASAANVINVVGITSGDTRFRLVGEDGTIEHIAVLVRSEKNPGKNTLILDLGKPIPLQPSKTKSVVFIYTDRQDLLQVMRDKDNPSIYMLTAKADGYCHIYVLFKDKSNEDYEVIIKKEKATKTK